jgi:UDP-2,4-diacetamido-2,4,6-trideoxy-beta-L-altropyranose hydrolase
LPVDPASLLLRADGNAGIGGGHVMRCLALAQAWEEAGGRAAFAAADIAPSLRQRLLDERFSVHSLDAIPGSPEDAKRTATVAGSCSAAAVIIDGYQFSAEFRAPLHAAGLMTVALDDNGETGRPVDSLIINQNIHASRALYGSGESKATLLLGTDFVLLRREFRQRLRASSCSGGLARRMLITLGQADPHNTTGVAIASLRNLDLSDIEIQVVVGGANPHLDAITRAAAALPSTEIIRDPGAGMVDLMARADLAIVAGGSTMWELSAMGVPFVVIVVAENQQRAAAAMEAFGFPVMQASDMAGRLPAKLGALIADAGLRRRLCEAGRKLVDGQGAARVVSEIRKRIAQS